MYRTKRDGESAAKSSLGKERTVLNVYLIPVLGNVWIGDLDLSEGPGFTNPSVTVGPSGSVCGGVAVTVAVTTLVSWSGVRADAEVRQLAGLRVL